MTQATNFQDAQIRKHARRVHNFFPGPASLPLEALDAVHDEWYDFAGTGVSILELSHRTAQYDDMHNETIALMHELLDIPANYKIMMLQGGGSLQFAMLPMNLLAGGKKADYVLTGIWSERAIKEAHLFGDIHVAGSSKQDRYRYIPKNLDIRPDAQYLYLTTNNTITGTQWFDFPHTDIPLIGDMSSDIMWRPFDVRPFGVIMAGAHKNLGPSGVTMVIIRDDMLEKCSRETTTMLNYHTHVQHNSMWNTPPTFTIYFIHKVLQHLKAMGGLSVMEAHNRDKAAAFYDFIDSTGGYYTNDIAVEDRSLMNLVFSLADDQLEARFCQEAWDAGFLGLKNLPVWGHCRISLYNAVSRASVDAVIDFMKQFMSVNG